MMGRALPVRRRLLVLVASALLLLGAGLAVADEEQQCRVINLDGTDQGLSFAQYTPRDEVSRRLLQRTTAEVRRAVKDAASISLKVRGEDLKEKVRQHHISAKIQPSGACFTIYYIITPVNECTAPEGSAYRHRCHPSTRCLDTEQSYQCVCPEGFEGEGTGRCGGKASTAECCGVAGADACKQHFVCVPSAAKGAQDGCKGQCVKEATCVQLSKERDLFECRCPDGQFGNGKHCFNGGPPPPAVIDRHGKLQGNNLAEEYCGCRVPTVDFCIGVDCGEHALCVSGEKDHECVCESGYTFVGDRCVDTQGLRIMLVGDEHVRLVQGDQYDDKLMRIQDENGMLHEAREITISMSDPVLNEETIDKVGNYSIVYSVKAPWTNTPDVMVQRDIEVMDLNECALKPGHPKWEKWRPMCHPWADCINTVGGYKCVCRAGTAGGGAANKASALAAEGHRPPENADDGPVGCRDVQPPALLVSDWEKTFKVCKCEGLGGPDTPPPAICRDRARDYGQELSDLLFRESKLCSDADWPCFEAYDDLADGERVNLTHRVRMAVDALEELTLSAEDQQQQQQQQQQEEVVEQRGRGNRRGAGGRGAAIRRFVLPLEVQDDAGNAAAAQLRFNVEEISLWDVIQPDKRPSRSPTMPRAPPPVPPPAPVWEEEEEEAAEAATTARRAQGTAEAEEASACSNESADASGGTPPRAKATSSSSTRTKPEEPYYDEEQGVAQLLFMLVVACLVALCVWGTRGSPLPEEGEAIAAGGGGPEDDPSEPSTSFAYVESPNPARSRPSGAGSPSPLRASPVPGFS